MYKTGAEGNAWERATSRSRSQCTAVIHKPLSYCGERKDVEGCSWRLRHLCLLHHAMAVLYIATLDINVIMAAALGRTGKVGVMP